MRVRRSASAVPSLRAAARIVNGKASNAASGDFGHNASHEVMVNRPYMSLRSSATSLMQAAFGPRVTTLSTCNPLGS